MAVQRTSKSKKLTAKPGKETTVRKRKIKSVPKTAPAKAKQEAPAKTRAASTAARRQIEQEHQPRVRRASFIVRLIVDDDGQRWRTEIVDGDQRRKQNFPGLDGDSLVAFMKARLSPDTARPAASPPEKSRTLTPGLLRLQSSPIVSSVRVSRRGEPGSMTLTLTAEEPFLVQTHFHFRGLDARPLTPWERSYEMKVYAHEITRGQSSLITAFGATLMEDVAGYTAPAQVPGLPPGVYRLFTVVTLGAPIKVAGFYSKTIIQVI
jgi:hypothetical protein